MSIDYSSMTSKGQVTIPKEVRDHIGVYAGQRVSFELRGDEVILKKAPTVESVAGSLRAYAKDKPVLSAHEMRELYEQHVAEEYRRKFVSS